MEGKLHKSAFKRVFQTMNYACFPVFRLFKMSTGPTDTTNNHVCILMYAQNLYIISKK